MLRKGYFYLKNDIEKQKLFSLITYVVVALLSSKFYFLYFTQSFYEIFFIVFFKIFLLLFTSSIFFAEKLIHRIKEKISNNDLLESQKGWILVDSLIGVVILSTTVIALLLAFTQATKGTTASTNRTQATYLAQQALENLKAQDGTSDIDTTIVPLAPPLDKYTIVIDTPPVDAITSDANQLGKFLKPYQVTVSWSDTSGGPVTKNVKIAGYFYVN